MYIVFETYLVQVVVLADEHLKLALDVENLLGRKLELDKWDLCFLEVAKEANLVGLQEHQTFALAVCTSCGTTDTVNVVSGVIRRVELDDPVDGGNIETTGSNIGTDQSSLLGVAEFEESVCTLLLLLLAVQVQNGQIDVVEEFGVVLDTVTRREEDDDLLLGVLLEECEQQLEPHVTLADDVTLLETGDSAVLLLVVDVDVQRSSS